MAKLAYTPGRLHSHNTADGAHTGGGGSTGSGGGGGGEGEGEGEAGMVPAQRTYPCPSSGQIAFKCCDAIKVKKDPLS